MFNYLSRHIRAVVTSAMLFALCGVSLVLAAGPVVNFAPRQFSSQQTHYLRFSITPTSCVLVSGSCVVKVGAVPYNAWIMRAEQQIATSFNSLTSDTLSIGTTSTSANELVTAQSIAATAGGATDLTVVTTARGTVVTGDGTTPTGANGGFDIYAKWTEVGTAATAGLVSVLIEYAAPNDGACKPALSLGSTAIAC